LKEERINYNFERGQELQTRNLVSHILTGIGIISFVLGVLLLNSFLVIFGIINMVISIFLPSPDE